MDDCESIRILATSDQVTQAIQALTPADHVRLLGAARIRHVGTRFATAEELYVEALTTPFRAAIGEGGRKWPPNVPFMAYLIKTIQGLASDSRNSAEMRKTLHVAEILGEDEHETRDVFDAINASSPSVEQSIINTEDDAQRDRSNSAALGIIRQHFAGDEEIEYIFMGLDDGYKADKIREVSGMTLTQYESARTRLRRGIAKLFPGRARS